MNTVDLLLKPPACRTYRAPLPALICKPSFSCVVVSLPPCGVVQWFQHVRERDTHTETESGKNIKQGYRKQWVRWHWRCYFQARVWVESLSHQLGMFAFKATIVFILFSWFATYSEAQTRTNLPCSNVCYSVARRAYDACWVNGRRLPHCHIIRCRQADRTQPYLGWSCSPLSRQNASPPPSPSPRSVAIPRGCRNICRTSAANAWDDCLYQNRTVTGCMVSRCPTTALPYPGWICAPKATPSPARSPSPTPRPQGSPTPTPGRQATCFTDPHCRTFDGLSFDCQAIGEFILIKSVPLKFQLQARFRGADTTGTVTKGIAVVLGSTPTIQVSMAFSPSSPSVNIGGCPVLMYVNGVSRSITSGTGSPAVSVTVDGIKLKIKYPNGIQIDSSVYESSTFGCYFESLTAFIPEPLISGSAITGLLGSPNRNPFDDWTTPSGGSVLPPRNDEESLFDRAYNYCTSNWCITNEDDSLFIYERGTTFRDFNKCDTPFGEPPNFDDASAELLSLCGVDSACLVDGLIGGLEDARTTLGAQAAADEQAAVLSPFRFDPAVVAVNASVSVRLTVDVSKQPSSLTAGLTAFVIYALNPDTGNIVPPDLAKLVDDGMDISSDFFKNDGIFSNSLAVLSKTAGERRSYRAIPVINGSEKRDSPLVVTALNAIRSYSRESNLGATKSSTAKTSFTIQSIVGLELVVRYSWPLSQQDLDTGTAFLSGVVGYSCSPDSQYLEFGGDDTTQGGTETIIVALDKANVDGAWSTSTKVTFRAGWYTSNGGTGPATLRMVLRDELKKEEVAASALELAINPGRQSECATTIVGVLQIKFINGGSQVQFDLNDA